MHEALHSVFGDPVLKEEIVASFARSGPVRLLWGMLEGESVW